MFDFKPGKVHSVVVLRDPNYRMLKPIVNFLRALLLYGIKRDAKYQIMRAQSKWFSVLVLLSLIAIQVTGTILGFGQYGFYRNYWQLSTFMFYMLNVIRILFTVYLAYRNVALDLKPYQVYYDNYLLIDGYLCIPTTYYERQKNQLALVFFLSVVLFVFKKTVTLALLYYSISDFKPILYNIHSTISTYIQHCAVSFMLVETKILQSKFSLFAKKVTNEVTEKKHVWEVGRSSLAQIFVQQKRCYQWFTNQYQFLQREYKWVVLVTVLYTLMIAMTTVVESDKPMTSLVSAGTSLVASGTLVTLITRELEKVSAARKELLLHLETVLVRRIMDPCDKDVLLSLMQLMRRHPLRFSINGLFHLNYRMLQMLVSLAVSYSIVLTQLQKQ